MKSWMFGFHAEPVLISAALRAIFVAAAAWGLKATSDQIAMTILAVEAVLAIIVRQNVTSQSTLHAAGTTQRNIVQLANANRKEDDLNG